MPRKPWGEIKIDAENREDRSFLLEQSSGSQLGMILPPAWLPSLGQLAMSRNIFGCHTWEGVATGI